MNPGIKKYDRISIKLLYLAIIPILIISLLLGAYFTSTRIQDVRENLMQKGNLIVGNLALSVEFGLFSHDVKFLKSLIDPLLSDNDVVSVYILDESRNPVVVRISPEYTASQLLADKIETSIFESAVYSSRFDSEYFTLDEQEKNKLSVTKLVSEPVPERKLMGWAVVKLSNFSSQQRQTEIILIALLLIILGVGVSGLIAYRIAKRIACPIMLLTDTVQEISKGNFDVRANTDGAGELQYLQQGVNAMAEIVQGSQQQLKQEVLQATQQLTDTIAQLEEKNTSLSSTQSELLRANAAKSEFLAKMSHEIRTPLTAVMGFSRLIETAEAKADIEAYSRIINRSGVQLLNIIDDILSFSKLDNDKQMLSVENINLRDTMDDILGMLSSSAKVKKIALVTQVSNEIPVYLMGDVVKLSQVLINLVNNAIKFTESGHVFVNLLLLDSGDEEVVIEFEVIDTGIGVPPEAREKIFGSFSQVESDKKRTFQGAGLGLAISKKLVELMGGQIGVDTLVESGSRFWFAVPLKLSTKVDDPACFQSLKQTVVLYDKLPVSRRATSKLLLRWKADLYTCEQVSEMLDLLGDPEIRVDSIVVSLDFKQSSASYVVNLIKQIRTSFNGQVILLSSSMAEEIRESIDIKPGGNSFDKEIDKEIDKIIQFSPITVLEKPVPNQRLHCALFSGDGQKLVKEVNKDEFSIQKENDIGDKFKILVAEDNKFNSTLIGELLTERGIDSVRVENAESVLESLNHVKYDMLLLDVHMPGMDGLTLASEIRKHKYVDDNVPIIAFTADVYIRNDIEMRMKGVNDVLYKPLSDDSLDRMLAMWLSGYHYSADTNDSHIQQLSEGENQHLYDDVLAHLNNIERSYSFNDSAAMHMHLHQLTGMLGYFHLDDILNKLKELEVHAYALDDDKFHNSLSDLIELVQNAVADV